MSELVMRDREAVAALHNAARRYCIQTHDHWCDEYTTLQAGRQVTFARTYTDDDFRVFPRYNVLETILAAVESWVPADVATLAEARARLIDAARTASSSKTDFSQPLANEAMAEERAAFERFVVESTADDWAKAAPLPFRRVMAPAEVAEHGRSFEDRWGIWSGGHCRKADLPPNVTLHAEVWDALPLLAAVRGFLAARGVERLIAEQENYESFEIDATATDFTYQWWQTCWFVAGCPWMIHASHEAAITFGGAELLDELRAQLPDLELFLYRGWDDPPRSAPASPARCPTRRSELLRR